MGVNLFRPSVDSYSGFVFYNTDEVAQETLDLQEIFGEQKEAYREESNFDQLDEWLAGLIPIAAPICSGDRYVLDTFNRRANGECSILFLNHEYYYSGICSPYDVDEFATTCIDLLGIILKNPIKYVGGNWTDSDANNRWQVDSAKLGDRTISMLEKNSAPTVAEYTSEYINNFEFEFEKVLLSELAGKIAKEGRAKVVTCLYAPLLNDRLYVVRMIAPKGLSFCDVRIYWNYIISVSNWAESFNSSEKKIIREEQKRAGWKSDDIYMDGPGFSQNQCYVDFCVLVDDLNIPVEYIKAMINNFPQPFIPIDQWKLDFINDDINNGIEGDLIKLVSNLGDWDDLVKVEKLKAVCRMLNSGAPHPIVTNVKARRQLLSSFSIGPMRDTGLLKAHHVWRAHLLRLLGWPFLMHSARICLNIPVDAEVVDDNGCVISWRGELNKFIEDVLQRCPVIDFEYNPNVDSYSSGEGKKT